MTVVRPNSIAGINSITVQTGQALNIHDASGNLIRNITSSSGVSTFSSLHVGSGTTTNTQGISVGTGCSIVSGTVNTLELYTNNSERFRIDSSGKILQGSSTSRNTGLMAASPTYQLEGVGSNASNIGIFCNSNGTAAGGIEFGKTNNLLVLGPGSNPDTTKGIFVKGTGSVGINTDSPEGTLAVDGSIAVSSNSTTVSPSGYDIKIRSNTSKLGIHCDTSGGTPILEFGIGGSTGAKITTNGTAGPLILAPNNSEKLRIDGSNGNITPGADATQDLGSISKRWANIYSADLQLSNEGSENEVDGSWGTYTIQEGESDLFLINRRNGKKYKFNLTEVS